MDRLPAPELPPWLERQLPFDRSLIRVHDQWMHVMEQRPQTGIGAPTVLLVHGNPTWGYLYRKVARALQGAPLHLVMPDLIGLGFSSKPTDPAAHTLDQHAAWLGALIETLRLDRVVLVVQDWGGPIALRAFADRPTRLAGLVVLNTTVGPPKPGFKPTLFHRFSRWPIVSDVVFRKLSFPQSALGIAQGDPTSIDPEATRAYRYPLEGKQRNLAPLALARMVPDSLDHPSVEPLTRCQRFVEDFKGPSAIVWGTQDPVLGRLLGRVHRALPEARVTSTEAGHFIQEERPQEIADAVLNTVERAVGWLRNPPHQPPQTIEG